MANEAFSSGFSVGFNAVSGELPSERFGTATIAGSSVVSASGARLVITNRQTYYAESLGTSSNSSTTLQTKLPLVFEPSSNSEYFILSSGLFGLNNNSVRFVTRIVNGSTEYSFHDYEAGSGSEIHPNFSVSRVVFGSNPGQQTFQYQFGLGTAGTATATLSDARLIAFSRHNNDGYGEGLNTTGASSTTYVTKITVPLDVPVDGYYLCVFSGETDTFSAPHSTGIRLTVDGTAQFTGYQANGDSNSWSPIGFAVRVFLTAGTRQIQVQHNTNATTRSDLRNARLLVLYLGTFKKSWSQINPSLTQTSATTSQAVLSLDADDSAPGDNIIFASFLGGVNNTAQAHKWDLVELPSTELMSRDGFAWSRAGASSTTIGYPYGWFFSRRTFSDSSAGTDRTWQFRHWSTLSSATIWTSPVALTAIDLTSPERFGSATVQLTNTASAQARSEARVVAVAGHVHTVSATVSSDARSSASLTLQHPLVTAQVQATSFASTSLSYIVTTAAISRKGDIQATPLPIVCNVDTSAEYGITPGAVIVLEPLSASLSAQALRSVSANVSISKTISILTDIRTERSDSADTISYDLNLALTYKTALVLIDASAGGAFTDRLMLRSGGLLRIGSGNAFLLHNEGFSTHLKAPSIRTVTAGYGLEQLIWNRALDPHEVLYYTIDWSEELGGTEDAISSGGSTWTLDMAGVTAGVIIPGGAHSYDSNSATVWLAVHPDRQENLYWTGLGQTHKITHQIRTLGGQVMERSIRVNIRTLKPVGT